MTNQLLKIIPVLLDHLQVEEFICAALRFFEMQSPVFARNGFYTSVNLNVVFLEDI